MPSPMLTDFMRTQSAKASFPIVSTLLEIVADIKLWQPEKAPMPMLATLLGMIIDAKPKQLVKALLPMLVTLFGIDVFLQPSMSVLLDFSMIALQPLRESYTVFPSSTFIDIKPLQPEKALSPMLVTLLGMKREVNP